MRVMTSSVEQSEASRRRTLLRRVTSVSRTFGISLLWLPGTVREQVALAYLLARISDTISDAPARVDLEERIEALRMMQQALNDPAMISQAVVAADKASQHLLSSEEGGLVSSAERQVLAEMGDWLQHAHSLAKVDLQLIAKTVCTIISGQIWDLHRFGAITGPWQMIQAATQEELEEYQYAVAGCVGKFWTEICERNLPVYATRSPEGLSRLGVEFGKGLQLINILRDRSEDLRRGRCYIPLAEQTLRSTDPSIQGRLLEASQGLYPIARRQLLAGLRYASRLAGARVRFVVLVPALLGLRTLHLVSMAGASALEKRIKVKRVEVQRIVLKALFLATNQRTLLRAMRRERVLKEESCMGRDCIDE